jgi:hypothetical protein
MRIVKTFEDRFADRGPTGFRPQRRRSEEAGFDPSQPRDESGRWSDGGGTGGSAPDMGDGSGAQGTSPHTADHEPGSTWKGQDPEWRSAVAAKMKAADANDKAAIKAIHNVTPGTGVIPDNAKDGSGHLLAKRGELFNASNVKMVNGKAGACHQNCAKMYGSEKFPRKAYGISTGYYMDSSEGLWRSHSWLYHRDSGRVIETTGNHATHYFGVKLTDSEAKTYVKNGGLLKDE